MRIQAMMNESNIIFLDKDYVGCQKCGNLVNCTCSLHERHTEKCQFIMAASLPFELSCEHGFQACPTCDACDCGSIYEEKGIQ